MTELSRTLTRVAWAAAGGNVALIEDVAFVGTGGVPCAYPVADFASAAIATAALSIAELLQLCHPAAAPVIVDRRLASSWFGMSIRPIGWAMSAPWDPIAGDYRARDGWIRLHTNAPMHRAAAERVLGCNPDRIGVARAVSGWSKLELEAAIVDAGGCAAEMRSAAEWSRHPQGRAVASEPLIWLAGTAAGRAVSWPVPADRPLQGVRVLDLTRVLAGPVATRFLAGFGADVLRIDPPDWDEPGVVPEVTLGKRCARLDFRQTADRGIFEQLLATADIIVHGYRPGALDRLDLGADRRRAICPGLIDVCLDAYGWTGPWAERRGFDSLLQMSTGIADTGMHVSGADRPVPLPFQALDHATGYLMAAAAVRGIIQRLRDGGGVEARLSLARTAALLLAQVGTEEAAFAPGSPTDQATAIEATDWGPARRVAAPVQVGGAVMQWAHPASRLGSAAAAWA